MKFAKTDLGQAIRLDHKMLLIGCRFKLKTIKLESELTYVQFNAPVLSKQTMSRWPASATRSGPVTKMPFLRSRPMAKTVQMVRQAGSAGGTAMVTISKNLNPIRSGVAPTAAMVVALQVKRPTQIKPISAMNFKLSDTKDSAGSRGCRMDRSSSPCGWNSNKRSTSKFGGRTGLLAVSIYP